MSFLEIRDLSFTYPNSGVRAIDGLDLDADRGEVIALVGPNAAGKSTLALLLKGLLQADSGTIRIDNKEQAAGSPNPHVGILFSNPENQLVTSIVEEDIAFGLEVLGESPPEIRKKVDAVLDRLRIAHLRKRMPHLMSGGEQQMTALAGVLVLDPDIMVLDEPTAYLDPDARISVLGSMRDLAMQGRVVILITHDMREAAGADRVVLLDHGRVVLEGDPCGFFRQRGIADEYGILPPFLLDLVSGLRASGVDVKWPSDPGSLARAVLQKIQYTPVSGPRGAGHVGAVPAGKPALVFDGVGFSYGQDTRRLEPVLSGVDFSVQQGTMALLCGANGSGKSTLLQMSNGLVLPDRGQIFLSGRDLKHWRQTRGGVPGQVALLFQNPERQVFSASVFEDIAFGPGNMGISAARIKERVLKAARWAGLPETVLDRPVHTLSSGQMRRVAVAGVLAMESKVLVLDEPTDGLDPEGGREFFTRARRYCDETGATVLVATHEVPEQISCIDHFGHLAGGRIQSAGPPSAVLTNPRRTLPIQFLPDHMIIQEELMESGVRPPDLKLDPAGARKWLLGLTGGPHLAGGT